LWLLAVEPASEDPRTAVTLAIIGLLSALGVALVGGISTVLIARQNKTRPADAQPTTPAPGIDQTFRDYLVAELAVARQRDDDNDERDDVQDRRHVASEHRLDLIEWYLDLKHPEWRRDR
jgi:hypothetical protein